jgi:hypothetical protein
MHTKYESQNLHRRGHVRDLNLVTQECNFDIGSGFAGEGQTVRCVLPVTDVFQSKGSWAKVQLCLLRAN